MSEKQKLEAMTDTELAAYARILVMSQSAVMSAEDRTLNDNHLRLVRMIMAERDAAKKRTKKTSAEHWLKYHNMARILGVTLDADDLRLFRVKDARHLGVRFDEDEWLNNIPLRYFDGFYPGLVAYNRGTIREHFGSLSMAECTSLYKHLLIFEVLGVTPEWEGDPPAEEDILP